MDTKLDFATAYAEAVVAGKKECACKAEIQACKRHLDDLQRDDLVWRPDIAEKHIQFAEKLHLYDKNKKKFFPCRLRGFQKFIVCSIFGWYQNDTRRYTEAYIQMARKNGKSFLDSFFCLDFSTLSAIKNGQIYCAGTNYANASIVWSDTKKLLEAEPQLLQYYTIKDYGDSRSKIINKHNGSVIAPLSGDTKKDGFLPYFASVDEYHLHETDEMYNVLLDGQVGLNGSLICAITTAGKDLTGPAYRQYKFAKQVLAGAVEADNLFCYIAEIDLPDSQKEAEAYYRTLWDERNWASANPLLLYDDDFHVTKDVQKWKDFTDQGKKAKREEGTVLNNFIIKKLDVWTTIGTDYFVRGEDWHACGGAPVDLTGKRCFLGLDLSSKNDLASVSAVFPQQEGLNLPYLYSHSFLPKGTLQRHMQQDKVPYDRWALQGLLTLTDCAGKNEFILDYRRIVDWLREFVEGNDLQVVMCCYDPMGISGILQDLDEILPNSELVEIVQTPKSMNDATRNFQGTVQGHGLRYDKNNKLLSFSVANALYVLNSKKEMIIDKKEQRRRIDPIDAVLDAWKGAMVEAATLSQAEKDKQTVDTWLTLMDRL